jgi:serine phosphatase RsbU (regulator of sigma subunit)
MKNRFQIVLSASITSVIILLFGLISWAVEQNLYQILVQQAIEDNRVIGASVLELLKKVHEKENRIENLIPDVQNSCDLLKLPNGGFVCATKDDGSLVAIPNLKPAEIGKVNLAQVGKFMSFEGKKKVDFPKNETGEFVGFFQAPDQTTSDIIVKTRHKSGLHILVHQNNDQIFQKAKSEGDRLFFWGMVISLVIGVLIYTFVNFQVLQYQRTIAKQNEKIVAAHHEIEEQHKDIIASINYAQRIQQSILPAQDEIGKFLPENFILFKPRDIVSGDFYYFQQKNELLILAVADCTGHGVPGALMTMLGNESLNEIILNKGITAPDLVLNELHKNIRKTLKQAETESRDGMDIALLTIDHANKKAQYAGAKNPLMYIQNNELQVLKADKMPIGGEQREQERIFTKHEISLDLPTTFYLFSDGFQDQFGGEQNKKFGSKHMKELFLQIQLLPLPTQQARLNEAFETWRGQGSEKQIDDVLVVGIKL